MRISTWQRNLAALWIGQTFTMVAFSFVFPFFPLYVQELGVEGTAEAAQWAGYVGAAAAISMAVAQPIWGNMADRWGRKPMVIRSMVGSAITVAAMGFVTSPEQLVALRFLQGAVSGVVSAANALVASSAPKERLGFSLGLMQVALFVGHALGPLGGGLIADAMGFRMPFYVAGGLMATGALIVVLFVHEDFTRPAAGTPRRGVLAEGRALFGIGLFPVLVVVIFLIQFGGVIVGPVLSLYVEELHGAANAATMAGVVIALNGVVSAVAAVLIGRVSDRIGPAVILPVCLVGSALTYLPQAFVQDVWQLLWLRMALGIFLGGMMPSANAMLAGLVPRARRGAAFGLAAMATSLANGAGPLSAAAIATYFDLRAIFLVTGGLFTFAFIWVTAGFRRHRAEMPRQVSSSEEAAERAPSSEVGSRQ